MAISLSMIPRIYFSTVVEELPSYLPHLLKRRQGIKEELIEKDCHTKQSRFLFLSCSPATLSLPPGLSDPQISVSTQEGGRKSPRRCCSNPAPQSSPPSPLLEGQTQGGRPPRSPHGQGGQMRGQRPTAAWEGQANSGSWSGALDSSTKSSSPQNHIGPVR